MPDRERVINGVHRMGRSVSCVRRHLLLAGAILGAFLAMAVSAPYYMTTQVGAFSEYDDVTTLKLPFGVEVIKRNTVRFSIDKGETEGEERRLWVRIAGTAGTDTSVLAIRVNAGALASLPAISDDLEPFANLLESISALEIWMNEDLITHQERSQARNVHGTLGVLKTFLDLEVKPAGKDRVNTPLGRLACEWYDLKGKSSPPRGMLTARGSMEFDGKFCLSRDVPFRWVKTDYEIRVRVEPVRRRPMTIVLRHEGLLKDYGPRETVRAPATRPPLILP
ncbi:MAG: hypothetical protein V2G42_09055 [bacterium JZ-2024 1]